MNVENIVRQYDFDIVIRRWLATVIDFVTMYLCLLGSALLGEAVLGETQQARETTAYICLAVLAAYFPVLEGWTGFTVGKFLLRIRVVDIDGKAPGFVRALLRTLIRLIEVNPILFGGIPAGIIALCSKKKQRLGDMLAHTYVIKTRDLRAVELSESARLSVVGIISAEPGREGKRADHPRNTGPVARDRVCGIGRKEKDFMKCYREAFAKRRTRQYIAFVLALATVAAVAVADSAGATALKPLGVMLLFGLLLFSWWNWRCPACGHYLGKGVSPTYCPSCGTQLLD